MIPPDMFGFARPDPEPAIVRGRLIATIRPSSGQDDAELVRLEHELLNTLARADRADIADDEADSLAHERRECKRRINTAPPETGVGAAVKLRQVLRVIDDGSDLADDEAISLRQLLAFLEGIAGTASL